MSQAINFINPFTQGTLQEQSAGLSENGAIVFPYKNGAYRLVEDDNYTQNIFTLQVFFIPAGNRKKTVIT